MKKLIVLFILMLTIFSYSADFRNVDFGMSIEEVKQLEKSEIEYENIVNNGESMVIYKTNLNNDDFYLMYLFYKNQLYMGAYYYQEKFSVSKCKFLYNKYKKLLKEKYGEENYSEENYNQIMFDSLLLVGETRLLTKWINKNKEGDIITIINVSGDNECICKFFIGYSYEPLLYLKNLEDEETTKSNL